jgi:hypothetical protein
MPSYKTAFPSKWLKADDCDPPRVLEIKSVGYEDVGTGTDVKRKLVIRFVECEQGFVLNITNGNMLESLLGTDDYDEWVGARIYLVSAKVMFKDKLVDAIRVQPMPTRKSRSRSSRPTPPAPVTSPDVPESADDPDDDVPF